MQATIRKHLISASMLAATLVVAVAPVSFASPAVPDPLVQLIVASNGHLASESAYLVFLRQQTSDAEQRVNMLSQQQVVLERKIAADRRATIPWLRVTYESGMSSFALLLQVVLAAHTFTRLESDASYLDFLVRERSHALAKLSSDEVHLQENERTAQALLEDLRVAEENVQAEQSLAAEASSASSSVSFDAALQAQLRSDWTTSIAPHIGHVLQVLDTTMAHLPPTVVHNVRWRGVQSAAATVDEEPLNRAIHRLNPALRGVQFLFRQNTWAVFATSGKHTFLLTGTVRITAHRTQLLFAVQYAAVDGILLPQATANAWLAPYTFTLDLAAMDPTLRIQSVKLASETMTLRVSIV